MDFGGEVIPRAAGEGRNVKAYLFNGYWEDIGTIKSFFEANLALAKDPPNFEFFDPKGPIVTSPRFLPPAKVMNCKVEDAIISHGTFVKNSTISNAIIGLRCQIGENVTIKDAMLMGSDNYEGEAARQQMIESGGVPMGVGDGSTIQNAIVDKGARIGKNVTITNVAGVDEANHEDEGYYIRSGIVVVLQGATIPDGTTIQCQS
eukprot:TRINITY_DN4190_c0_g3_i1.p1 TRINITY_DN4190_c0_g3~~TRINITY_DN4190_c0_g3_i1.p1  ORF type:complete len:222 (-),score=40.99 TRINITY_DN4190_c0_g3_i1:310-921(-)